MSVDWDELVRLYRTILRETGGEFGFVSEGTMRYIVDTISHMKEDAFSKAAFAIHEIATKHPLANGNKRLALALGDMLLRRDGYKLSWEVDETVKFMLQIARGQVTRKEIERWLRDKSKKTP
jgi:death-on-curing family protein